MIVFEAIKKCNGRVTEKTLAETLDLAKVKARNWVRLSEPELWEDRSPEWDWKEKPKRVVLVNAPKDEEIIIKRRAVSTKSTDEKDE